MNRNDKEQKRGKIEKEISYMLAVPKSEDEIKDSAVIEKRLKESNLFVAKNIYCSSTIKADILYLGEIYKVEIIPENYEVTPMYTRNHTLKEEDYEILNNMDIGLTVAMQFNDNILESYHLQLKILYTIIPDMAACIDFSTQKVLSGIWVGLCAESQIPPSPDYVYNVQAISGKSGEVWLHTHGLNRCGAVELEIIDSDKENYINQYYIIQTLAKRIISDNDFINEGEGIWAGRMNNGDNIIATWIDFKKAVEEYPEDIEGGKLDREESHNINTGVIYLYLCEEDYNEGKYTHVSAINKYISDNALMMYTTEETERMSDLARERIKYFIEGVQDEKVNGIIKIGMEVDDEYKNEDNTFKEHIWFEVIDIEENKVHAILTQEPYYIKDLRAGTEMYVDLNDMTDWVLYTEKGQITPDNVYLLEL